MRKPNVLFLCTRNACRSQMAEGWAKALLPEHINAYSAGTHPLGVDSRAIAVMKEAGVDISQYTSKSVDELASLQFDWVVTVCDRAAEACPTFSGNAQKLHHSFGDPPKLVESLVGDEALIPNRRVRDEIKAFVQTLPTLLTTQTGTLT